MKKTTQKYVTESSIEKHMRAIAHSFDSHGKILERHEDVLNMIVKELRNLHEDHKKMNDTLSGFVSEVYKHDRKINSLTMRVEKLEA